MSEVAIKDWKRGDVAIRRVLPAGTWDVIRLGVKGWKRLQRVHPTNGIDAEQAARAWANWWSTTIEVHGLTGALDRFAGELERVQLLATCTTPEELKIRLEQLEALEDPIGHRNRLEDKLGGDERDRGE